MAKHSSDGGYLQIDIKCLTSCHYKCIRCLGKHEVQKCLTSVPGGLSSSEKKSRTVITCTCELIRPIIHEELNRWLRSGGKKINVCAEKIKSARFYFVVENVLFFSLSLRVLYLINNMVPNLIRTCDLC